jgi:hypothetical protein
VDGLHVVVDVSFVLVFGGHVLVGIVSVSHAGVVVFVLVGGAEVLEAPDVQVPVMGYVVMAVAMCHALVGVFLPFGLRIGHRVTPFEARLL